MSEHYLSARQRKAQAAQRAKQRRQDREQAHLKRLDNLISGWLKDTQTVIKQEDERGLDAQPIR